MFSCNSETYITINTVKKQNNGRKGDLKPEHKKTEPRRSLPQNIQAVT